uniref:Uncharacterized protein n=2 Tax=Cacopsylla melanoneura TaxID=428564 RepID=A0A8D8QT74_9HEMI
MSLEALLFVLLYNPTNNFQENSMGISSSVSSFSLTLLRSNYNVYSCVQIYFMYLERGHPPASSLKTFLISCPRLFRKREKPLIKARGRYHSSAPLALLLSICSWTEEKEENEVSRVQITFFFILQLTGKKLVF